MKINEKELDKELIRKINRLTDIEADFGNQEPNPNNINLISYNGEKFLTEKFNKKLITRILSQDDLESIVSLSKVRHTRKNIKNCFSNINKNNTGCLNFKSLSCTLNAKSQNEIGYSIKEYKLLNNQILFLSFDGKVCIYDYKKHEMLHTLEPVQLIKQFLNLTDINNTSILDFIPYRNGILLSTSNRGVYYISFDKTEIELVLSENGLTRIHLIGIDRLFAVDSEKDIVILFNLDNKSRVKSWGTLKRNGFQIPTQISQKDNIIFLFSHSYYTNSKCISGWKIDQSGIELTDITESIQDNFKTNDFKPYKLIFDDSAFYLIGFINRDIKIYKYSYLSLEYKPEEYLIKLNNTELSEIQNINVYNDKIFLNIGQMLIEFSLNGEIEKILNLQNSFSNLFIENNIIYGITDDGYIMEYNYPIYSKKSEIFITISEKYECNNIDIFVKTASNLKFVFLDNDQPREIAPDICLKTQNGYLIKLFNKQCPNMYLKIAMGQNDSIDDIIIHQNQLYTMEDFL